MSVDTSARFVNSSLVGASTPPRRSSPEALYTWALPWSLEATCARDRMRAIPTLILVRPAQGGAATVAGRPKRPFVLHSPPLAPRDGNLKRG